MPRLALVLLLGFLLGPHAPAGAASSTLTVAQVDVDGDGRADTVTVSLDGRVAVRRANGLSEALSFNALPSLSRAFIEVWPGLGSTRYLRVEGHPTAGGKQLLLAVLHGGRLDEIYNGPVGPVGRDGEYSVEVQRSGGEILRYQTTPTVRRCDGENRLFLERYSEPDGWRPAPEVAAPPPGTVPPLRTSTTAPSDLSGPPLGVFRYTAASLQGNIIRADLLTPPRELDDGNRGTAWRLPRDPRGAFVTAQADGSGHAVRALRIEAATPAGPGSLPRRLALVLEGKTVVEVDLLPAATTQWLRLPEAIPSRCLSLVVREGAATGSTALGEVAIYSELDGTAGLSALVERVARGDSTDAEGALRTLRSLASRRGPGGPPLVDDVVRLLPTAQGDGKRRLLELLGDLLMPPGAPSLDGDALGRLTDAVQAALASLPASTQAVLLPTLSRAPALGPRLLERTAQTEGASPELRMAAIGRLGAGEPASAVPTLLRLTPALAGSPGLLRAVGNALQAALRCRDRGAGGVPDSLVASVESFFSESVQATGAEAERRMTLAATVVQALAQAQAGCPDGDARARRADWLAAVWPTVAGDASPTAGQFVLAYRVMQGLERLATATPTALALCNRVLDGEREPVLRQAAGRALLAMQSAGPGAHPTERLRGLRDADAGVRLATLGALEGSLAGGADPSLLAALEERLVSDGWPQVRRVAAEARAAACPTSPSLTSASPGLRKALTDRDEQVQRVALMGVARCEGTGAVELLAGIAATDSERRSIPAGTRGLACLLLARHGFSAERAETRAQAHRAAATALIELLQDPGADERHAAALSQCLLGLRSHGSAEDLQPLMDVAGSEVPAPLRQGALDGITAICGRRPALSPALRKSLAALQKGAAADPDKRIQKSAAGLGSCR